VRPAPPTASAGRDGPHARHDAGLVLLGSALIAPRRARHPASVLAPITGQTFAVLLVGAALGPWRGAAAIVAYLAEGAVGLPVFAGVHTGPAALFGPTGGYLFGFVPAAWICGYLAERGWDRSVWGTVAAMVLGNGAIFAAALPWLDRFVGLSNVLDLGCWPFIPATW
jgi:biotin transport system substrate-specific component